MNRPLHLPLRIVPPPAPPTDGELVEHARDGQLWAKEALYRKHVDRLSALAMRLLRNRADAEDAVQDVFIRGFKDLDSLRNPERVGSWLATSLVHRIHKIFRRRKLQRVLGLYGTREDEGLAEQAVDHASPETRAELALLDRALCRLSDDDRTTWVLRHLMGHPIFEVTEMTGCSAATVHRRLARAESHLFRAFGGGQDA